MSYLNAWRRASVAIALLLLAAPGLRAQEPASAASALIRGDVDGDGRVTRADAEAVRTYLVRGTLPGGRSILPAGDANGDGRVTAADAALISRFAAGVDVSRFPVGRPVEGGQAGPESGTLQTGDQLCTVDVRAGTVSCSEVVSGGAGAQNLILGDPFVTFVTNFTFSEDNSANEDTATYTVRIRNAAQQPLGTLDGTTLAPGGIRLFFITPPTVKAATPGPTAIRLETPDGTATFTNQNGSLTYANRPYFQYNEVLAPADTTAARSMQFIYSSNVTTFSYAYRVSAPAQFEHGWITVSPSVVPVIAVDSSTTLSGVVYDQVGRVQGDGISWSSSNPAVATVNASGVVTGVAEGTVTITATSTVNNQRTGSRPVTVDRFPTVVSTVPADEAVGVLPGSDIVVNFSEPVNVTTASFDLECPSGSPVSFTVSGSGTSAITINPDSDLPAATVCTVVVDGNEVTDVDTNDGPDMMPGNYEFSFEVSIQAVPDVFGTTTTGNVRINSASTSPVFSVTANDAIKPGATTISFAGWNAVSGKTQNGGDVVMDTEGDGMGTFTYNPPAGFEGTDSLEYTIQSGAATSSAKVALPVSGMIWFVNNGGAACTTRASGCGRLTNPYSTLAAFQAENNGTGNNPAAGDNIFLYQSATTYTGPVTLLGQQKLIGQDAGATLSTITGITPATGSDALPAMDPAGTTVTISGAAGGVTLANIGANSGTNNTVRGLSISTSGGAALSGTSFGSPVIEEVPISATGGPSLSLNGGTVNSTFATASSVGSTTQGMSLTSLSGTLTFGSGTTLSNSTGTVLLVSGGAPAITYSGGINKDGASAGRLVDISGTTAGTITFNTGTLSSTSSAGTGIQLSNAAGTVNFNGTTTLNGGDAGIDILAGSTGTFTFSANTLVQNPTGTAFNVNGSTPTVTFNGSLLRTANNALLVDLTTVASGSITFDPAAGTDSLYATTGDGIQLSNVDGAVDFNGRVRLAGGNAGVDITGGSIGNIDFDAATIANPTGEALRISNGGSATDVSFAGGISTNAGRPVLVEGVSSGTVAVSASINTTAGLGLLVQNNTGGTMTFSNATQSLNTAANAAVSLVNNTGATVNFTGGTLDIDVTSGAGFTATGGGTVTVTGANNTVASTAGGIPVNIQNTSIGGGNVTFRSVNKSTGSGYGIRLENTGTSGGLRVTGDGSTANSGGTITQSAATSADSAAVTLSNTGDLSLQFMRFSITTGSGSSGIAASGLTGTNLVQKSTIDFNNVVPDAVPLNPAYGARFLQNANATITLDAVTIQNKLDGTAAGSLSAGGTGTVNFNVIDSNTGDGFGSTMQGLFGSGWVISSGDTGGSTGSVNATISDSRFQNAATNGTNNLELGANASSTLNYKIKNNVFSGVANSSFIAGIINIQTFDTAVMGGNTAMDSITGNTITNSGTSSAVNDLGYVGIRVALQSSAATTHRVVIANNQITDLWRQGLLLSTRQSATGHFKVVNNTVGTLAAPVGQSGRRGLETDLQDNSVMNLEATGNTFTATSTIDTRAAVGIRVGTNSGSATLNATVLSNTMQSTVAGNNGRFSAESSSVGTGTMCLDLRSNTLDGATRLFSLTQSGGTFRVEGAGAGAVSNAAVQAANTVGTGNVSGTVNFNNGANCTQPPI